MVNISMSFERGLNFAQKGQRQAIKPVIISSLTNVSTSNEMPDATNHFGTMTTASEYEVFCPNCGRIEIANTCDLVKHKCNCGYGVFVEMLRASPN